MSANRPTALVTGAARRLGRALAEALRGLIDWRELDGFEGANALTIRNADRLIERAGSKRLAGWGEADQALPKF